MLNHLLKKYNKLDQTRLVHFRELNPEITLNDFHICTSVDFKRVPLIEFDCDGNDILHNWDLIKKESKIDYYFVSKWKSRYMGIEGKMYRLSNHWGGVKTCRWTLEGEGELRPHIFDTSMSWEIGVADLKDFEVFRRKEARKCDFLLNPKWVEFIESNRGLLDVLGEYKKTDDFKNLPNILKSLLGSSYGLLNKLLLYIKNYGNL